MDIHISTSDGSPIYEQIARQIKGQILSGVLKPGDALVVNETRVLPARLYGVRENGGPAELLLLKQVGPKRWETLVKPGRRLKPGATVYFGGDKLIGHILDVTDDGGRIIEFECEGTMESGLDELGETPLPRISMKSWRTRSAIRRCTPASRVRPPRPPPGCTLPRSSSPR